MKGIFSVLCVAALALCSIGGLCATISSGEYVQAVGVAVTSLMAVPYVVNRVKEGLK